jgi:hypothetical protein
MMFHQQNPVISLEIVLNPPKARHATAAAKLDISLGSVLNKMVVLLNKVVVEEECAAQVLTATNVPTTPSQRASLTLQAARLVILLETVP